MGLFAGQKWCISGKPGNTLLGHHLSVGSPSVCSQDMPCQALWSGMLGLGRGGQRQLRFSKAMDSHFTACPHHSGMQTAFLVHKLKKLTPNGCSPDAHATFHSFKHELFSFMIISKSTKSDPQTMHPVLLA